MFKFVKVFGVAFLFFLILPVFASAEENNKVDNSVFDVAPENIVEVDRADYGSDEEYNLAVEAFINDPDNIIVTTVDTRENLAEKLFETNLQEDIQPMSVRIPYATNGKFDRRASVYRLLGTVWAQPGINASLTNSWGVTASFQSVAGIKAGQVSAELGWSVSKSYTVSYSGSYTAPRTYNGKRVDHVELEAHPVMNIYSYSVYKPSGLTGYTYAGKGRAYKPVGVSYIKNYFYK